mgnify:FL=1
MSYFPTFLNFENKKILIIGAGKVANDKLSHLLDFTNNITIISPDMTPTILGTIENNSLEFFQRKYLSGDIKGYDIVIAAVNDISLQEEIYFESRSERCLYNCVDIKKYCDFIFPSYIKKGDLTISISTQGSAPSFAKHLRIYLEKIIPNSVSEFLLEMKNYRSTLPKGKDRMKFLEEKTKSYFKNWKINE